MDGLKHQKLDDEQAYDGALQQITPAPEHFVPQGMLEFDKKEEVTVKRKPRRKRIWAAILYFTLQGIVFLGILLNYSPFGGLADVVLWGLTITTFIAYFRVSFSDPGYFDGNVIILKDHENELNEYDLNAAKEDQSKSKKLSLHFS